MFILQGRLSQRLNKSFVKVCILQSTVTKHKHNTEQLSFAVLNLHWIELGGLFFFLISTICSASLQKCRWYLLLLIYGTHRNCACSFSFTPFHKYGAFEWETIGSVTRAVTTPSFCCRRARWSVREGTLARVVRLSVRQRMNRKWASNWDENEVSIFRDGIASEVRELMRIAKAKRNNCSWRSNENNFFYIMPAVQSLKRSAFDVYLLSVRERPFPKSGGNKNLIQFWNLNIVQSGRLDSFIFHWDISSFIQRTLSIQRAKNKLSPTSNNHTVDQPVCCW